MVSARPCSSSSPLKAELLQHFSSECGLLVLLRLATGRLLFSTNRRHLLHCPPSPPSASSPSAPITPAAVIYPPPASHSKMPVEPYQQTPGNTPPSPVKPPPATVPAATAPAYSYTTRSGSRHQTRQLQLSCDV